MSYLFTSKIAHKVATQRVARAKVACIIATGVFDGSRILFKNRDRNYTPKVTVYHEFRDGVEVLYMRDMATGWVEGINENGLGIVNSALLVGRDESEKRLVVENDGKKLKDGRIVLDALSQRSVDAALEVVQTQRGGLMGHTIVADPDGGVSLEMTTKHAPKVNHLDDQIYVRTNHGIVYPEAGYTEGEDLVSSVARRERAVSRFKEMQKPSDIAPGIYGHRIFDHSDPNNMVRDTDNLRTVTQMVLDLTKRKMYLYLIPGKVHFMGYVNELPPDYKPKIKFEVYKYTDIDGDGDFDVVRRKDKKPIKPTDPKSTKKATVDVFYPLGRSAPPGMDHYIQGSVQGRRGVVVSYPARVAYHLFGHGSSNVGARRIRMASVEGGATTPVLVFTNPIVRQAGMLPLQDPAFNLREIVKQLLLLEDHLFHADRQCADCIWKHLLTAEAFADEAVTLGGVNPIPPDVTDRIRTLGFAIQSGVPLVKVAQLARTTRKALLALIAAR